MVAEEGRANGVRHCRKCKCADFRRRHLKSIQLGLSNMHILYWNCASAKQHGPILERQQQLVSADIVALQEIQFGVIASLEWQRFISSIINNILVRPSLFMAV